MKFTKMHGIGNDYVYIDCFSEKVPDDPASLALCIADRHTGVGGDGLVLILPPTDPGLAAAKMRMFNADGSESEMCGNAIRCVGKYLYDHGICRKDVLAVETGNGLRELRLFPGKDGRVDAARVDMGKPVLEPGLVPTTLRAKGKEPTAPVVEEQFQAAGRSFSVTCVSMGNPHCVVFVDRLDDAWVHTVGPALERHEAFPKRVNAEFVEVLTPTQVRMRVWERGSGETRACGTGACAIAVAGVLAGKTERKITVRLDGGPLEIEWDAATGRVSMTGGATEVFAGDYIPAQSSG